MQSEPMPAWREGPTDTYMAMVLPWELSEWVENPRPERSRGFPDGGYSMTLLRQACTCSNPRLGGAYAFTVASSGVSVRSGNKTRRARASISQILDKTPQI